jgi:aminobenzoyl-glutamate utilization protein B
VWWYFRGPTAEAALSVFERAKKIAEGAAMMTDTTVEIDVQSAVWPVRSNRTLADLVQMQYEEVGPPDWSSEEDCLARDLQLRTGANVEGLSRDVFRMTGPAVQKGFSNDAGDISWKVPMAKFYFPANIPNINFHHWAAGVALATSVAHKGAVAGAKVLSASLIEIFCNPEIVGEAKRVFQDEKAGVKWFSMLPADQRPPLDLNRAAMDRYRSLMSEHYQPRRPKWSSLV